jgi:5-methylcytosine-specific restriction protein A
MPSRLRKPCGQVGCPALTHDRFCPQHTQRYQKQLTSERPDYHSMYNTDRWRKLRRLYLNEHPFCCDPFGTHGSKLVQADVVDHVLPHRGDYDLMWSDSNLQALCSACHAAKTARERAALSHRR